MQVVATGLTTKLSKNRGIYIRDGWDRTAVLRYVTVFRPHTADSRADAVTCRSSISITLTSFPSRCGDITGVVMVPSHPMFQELRTVGRCEIRRRSASDGTLRSRLEDVRILPEMSNAGSVRGAHFNFAQRLNNFPQPIGLPLFRTASPGALLDVGDCYVTRVPPEARKITSTAPVRVDITLLLPFL